jgi:hypothetical protein
MGGISIRPSRQSGRLHSNRVGVFGGGEPGEERSDFAEVLGGVAGGAEDGDVSGARVGYQDEIAGAGEGESVEAVSWIDLLGLVTFASGDSSATRPNIVPE